MSCREVCCCAYGPRVYLSMPLAVEETVLSSSISWDAWEEKRICKGECNGDIWRVI